MNRDVLESFLEDLTYNSELKFLEFSKDNKELLEVAEKARIVMPSPDISLFKCIYAYTDRINKNGCALPKEEVEKALPTLIGKSIDFDHLRKKVCGTWLDAKIEDDKIIAYGAFYKSSFTEDYEVIQELFSNNNLAISFEAWGKRDFKKNGSYDLKNIHFAGGALLIKESPAFTGAGVLEMAKDRVLEMAKVMTKPESFIKASGEDKESLEESRYYLYDSSQIMQSLSETECGSCNEKYSQDVMMMDYENNKAKTKCMNCGAEMMVNFTPQSKLTKKGRKVKKLTDLSAAGKIEDVQSYIKDFDGPEIALEMLLEQSLEEPNKLTYEQRSELNDEDFAIATTVENKKVRIFPIHDWAHALYAEKKIEQSRIDAFVTEIGLQKDIIKNKINRRITNCSMKELLEKYKKGSVNEVLQEIAKASINRELTKEELEKAALGVANLQTLKKSTGSPSDTSLNKTKTTPANDNSAHKSDSQPTAQSLQNASMSEDEVKSIVIDAVKLPEQAKSTEALEWKAKYEEATKKLSDLTKKFEEASAKLDEIEKAKVAELVKARREELGDSAKDLKDEDLLNEDKFTIAKLKKENEDLKKGSTKTLPKKQEFSKGSSDKGESIADIRKRVQEMAFGKDPEGDDDK